MATATVDMLDQEITLEDRYGVAVSCTRTALIEGLTPSSYGDGEKFQVLWDALDAVGITPGSKCTNHDNLVLAGRRVTVMDLDKAYVTLTYEHFMMSDSQRLDAPVHGKLFYRTVGSLESLETQLDQEGNQITVAYTYPSTGMGREKYPGETRTQGGTIQVTEVRRTKTLTGILETSDPDGIVTGILNRVNSEVWQNGDAYTWKCTAANYDPWDLEGGDETIYRFFFEFAYNPDTHKPGVMFIDEDTGRPPHNLVADTGYKSVDYYDTVDFNDYFQPGHFDPEPN